MESVIFEIDRTKRGGQELYELLKRSDYAKLIKIKTGRTTQEEYTFDDLNEATKKAFADSDAGKTHKSENMEDLFGQLGI